jgi:hypothetical protein
MTCGIYKLKFAGTDQVYIGKSKNIEARFIYHKYKITHNKASNKLMAAYNTYGCPSLEIICTCDEAELSNLEEEAIEIYDSVNRGFNTLHKSSIVGSIGGENHHNAVNSNEDVIACLLLLIEIPVHTYKEISHLTGVTYSTVCDIAKGATHTWLKKEYPIEYAKMLALKASRKTIAFSLDKNITILDPTGKEYIIENIRKFSRQHNLCQSHLGSVINGKTKQHKGWSLKKTGIPDGL